MLFDMGLGIADLHWRGMGPQVECHAIRPVHVHIEGVLHRTGRVIGRIVQCSEAVPVGLDLGAIGHIEAHAGKGRLDPFPGQRDGMQAAGATLAPGQCHIQGLGAQLLLQFFVSQRPTPGIQGGLNGLLGQIDRCATRLLFFHAQGCHALHQFGHSPGLAKKQSLGVFQIGRCHGMSKSLPGTFNDGVEIVHTHSSNAQGLVPFQALALASIA
jgi:hypothetical protein